MNHISCYRECEKIHPHIPKWVPILGVGVSMNFWIFQELSNGIWIKMGLHNLFGCLKDKLWLKEGSKFKLPIWLLTTKNQESPWFPCMQVVCDISLESFQRKLELFFRPHLNWRFAHKVMNPQSCRSPCLKNLGIQFASLGTKWDLGVRPVARHKEHYKGEGGGFPQVWVVVSLVSSCLPVVVHAPKVFQLCTN
jgi:hypothetical protein